MYQLQTRLIDILNYPLVERIHHLRYCIDTLPLKDLQGIFPLLINSIFNTQNGLGWGIRTITNNCPEYFLLYNFFNPHEAFFRLLYRLQSGYVKFEMNFHELPKGFKNMLETERSLSTFYSSMINIDHFQSSKTLQMNAFDYFMLNFAIHGTKNLHKISPAAMAVNNENLITVYFSLVADYACNFLPGDPNSIIYPQIDASPMKNPPSIQLPAMQPTKRPKYLLLSSISHQSPSNQLQRDVRFQQEAVRSSNWRSESVLMIFIDCWLRYDVEETYELPSNELIRVLRILVKQIHFFGNAAEQDNSSLSVLRQQAQLLLNARMYSFLKFIMTRWPLDSSFLNVLELWLSYIQPWRYLANRNIQDLNSDLVIIPDKFKKFMSENLVSYTQIFVRTIPRFLKMDLGVNKNAFMLFRMLKVFRQPSDTLREMEKFSINNNSMGRTHHSSINDITISSPSSSHNNSSFNRSLRHHSASGLDDSTYICMFGEETTMQIFELMQRAYGAKMKCNQEVAAMEKQINQNETMWERFLRIVGMLSSFSISFTQALDDKKKAPHYLDSCLNFISPIYSIPIDEVTRGFAAENMTALGDESDHDTLNSDYLNITPSFMKSQLSKISYSGDPALLPIMDSEIKFLVRFFYQISTKINEMFENEFDSIYSREDFYGRFAKQILTAPVETRMFDKSHGVPELQVQQIGPRISFRKFANKKTLFLLIISCVIGRMFFGASSLGFIIYLFSSFLYLILKAIIST